MGDMFIQCWIKDFIPMQKAGHSVYAVLQNFCHSLSYISSKCSKTLELTATQIIKFLSYVHLHVLSYTRYNSCPEMAVSKRFESIFTGGWCTPTANTNIPEGVLEQPPFFTPLVIKDPSIFSTSTLIHSERSSLTGL